MTERGQAIVLIGFMGVGKSSVGRRLEERTGLPRFDTDEMVTAKFRLPIVQIFERHSEDVFREAENEILRSFDSHHAAIIVTGGGVVLREENRDQLRQLGTIVYLYASEEILFERALRRSSRPLLRTGDPRTTLKELLEKRLPLYKAIADLTVDASQLDQSKVCDFILQNLPAATKNRHAS